MSVRVLGRYSEVFLKRGRRRYFLDVLGANARAALADLDGVRVRMPHGRLMVEADAGADAVVDRLVRVFGLTDLSVADAIEREDAGDVDSLVRHVGPTVAAAVGDAKLRGATTFRVTARRTDKTFAINSTELGARLGGEVLDRHPEMVVKLRGADVDVEVELRPDRVFVSAGRIRAAGGLPVSSNGRAVLLLSGGIDSPVAGWLTLKRGVRVEAVTFDSFPLTGRQAQEKVRELAQSLARWAPAVTLHIVPFGDLQLMFRDKAPARQLLLLYRRSMFRLADRIASKVRAAALSTGESIGQVASQTLPNMRAIEAVTLTPVLRPLVSHDKAETIELAQRLGTYAVSVRPHDDCCSLFVPPHPELRGDPDELARLEAGMEDLGRLEDEALAARTIEHMDGYGIARRR